MLNFASTAADKWSSLKVTHHAGSIADVAAHVPTFERWSTANAQFDWIVRRPLPGERLSEPVPVAGVRKTYELVQHRSVIEAAVKALDAAGIAPSDVEAELATTTCGERIALSLRLPERYSFDPGDGHEMALRFECLNSVDGSSRLRALVGWYRLVCCNGLIVGTTHADVRMRHSGACDLAEISSALTSGIAAAQEEKGRLAAWRHFYIDPQRVATWVDGPVRNTWGFKAATRAWHILRCGTDAIVTGPWRDTLPTTVDVQPGNAVPGQPARSENLYDIAQALAWLARQRRDFREQFRWREQIPELLAML